MKTRAALVLAALALVPSTLGCKAAEEAQEQLPFELALEFDGQETVGAEALEEIVRRELVRLEVEAPDKAAIDDAAFALELFYRSRGHADVQVAYEFDPAGTPKPLARFHVREGPAVRVRELVIEGARAFELDTVREYFGEAAQGGVYDESQLGNAISRLRAAYRSDGYQRIEIEEPVVEIDAGRASVSIRVVLHEGPRFQVRAIEIEGGLAELARREQEIASDRTGPPDRPGPPYVPQVLAEIEHALIEAYRREGHPDVTVAVAPDLDEETGDVRISARITPGERVTIAHFRIQGNARTRDSTILSLIGIERGSRYDSERLRESFRDLYGTGLFESVAFELEGTGPERTLLVDLVEAHSVEIRIEPGWGSYEGPRFLMGIEERNFLGRGQIVSVEGTVSLRAQALRLGWIDRDFLGTNFTSETSAFVERREEPTFEFVRRGLGFFLGRELGTDWRTSFGYEFRPTNVTDEDIPMGPDDEIEIATLSAALTLEDRDNLLLPTRGRQGRLKLEWADDGLGSQTEFLRAQLEYTHLFRLSKRGVLAASARTGVIAPFGNTETGEIPLPERFFNGGESSVRSFREDQLPAELPSDFDPDTDPPFDIDSGGEAATTVNLELRRRLSGNLAVALFYDRGNVTSEVQDYLHFDGFRSGIGVGVRYLLPIGPVRLDLGYNPNARDNDPNTANEDEGEDDFVLHFSVGFPF